MNIKEIKELAEKFTPEQLENCILQTIQEGKNECEISGDIEVLIL